MTWFDEAERLYEMSSLGRRQAQVAILSDHGHTPDEIVALINEHEDAPKPETIQSIQSKLRRELLDVSITQQVLANGFAGVRPPVQVSDDSTPTFTAHAYIGGVGAGKTVTAQSHALRLTQIYDNAEIIVLDVIGEWEHVDDTIPHMTRIEPDDETRIYTDELIDKIQSQDADTHTAVFLPQAHRVFDDTTTFVKEIRSEANNLSLRIVTQTVSDLPSSVVPNVYHFHRSTDKSTKEWLQERTGPRDQALETEVSELPRQFPKPYIGDNAAYVLSVLPETDETMLRMNILTEHEHSILL